MSDESEIYRGQSRTALLAGRVLVYAALVLWASVCLFPLYWTVTTSFKAAVNVTQGHLVPFVDFQPDWRGWRSLGLSPDTILSTSTVREEFVKRIAKRVTVLHEGSVLAEGTLDEVKANEAVVEVYLGR